MRRRWLPSARRTYTLAMTIATAIGGALLLMLEAPGAGAQAALMLMLVGALGLPHGAFDLELGRRWLRPRLGWAWAPAFGGVYLAGAAAGAAFWSAAPVAGLGALLILGVVHWGLDDLERPPRSNALRAWLGVSRGLPPVALVCLFHPDTTASIFNDLTRPGAFAGAETQRAAVIALALAAPGLAFQLVRLWRRGETRLEGALATGELAALTLWFAGAPPLLAFAGYFCCWHSVRHAMRSAATIDAFDPARAARRYALCVAPATLLTIALALGAWRLLPASAGFDANASRIVFIGLFALTIPHVTLEWFTPAGSAAPDPISNADPRFSKRARHAQRTPTS